jgi:hypothetical protein
MEQHKTKVIAFRVRDDEYEALKAYGLNWFNTLGAYVYDCMHEPIQKAMAEALKERKKAEAKAKRLAKKEAASGL